MSPKLSDSYSFSREFEPIQRLPLFYWTRHFASLLSTFGSGSGFDNQTKWII